MLKIKEAHGTGVDPVFPVQADVEEQMAGLPRSFYVPAFGDGGVSTCGRAVQRRHPQLPLAVLCVDVGTVGDEELDINPYAA